MNKKQKMTIIILSIFIVGMCIGAVDAAHTVKKGKYKVKISDKEYKKLTSYETKYKTVEKTKNVTKTKKVTKTKQVVKNKTETENRSAYIFRDNFTLYNNDSGHYEEYEITYNTSDEEIKLVTKTTDIVDGHSVELDSGYVLVSSTDTYYSEPKTWVKRVYNYNHRVTNLSETTEAFDFTHNIGKIDLCFEKNTTYTESQQYTVDEPYTETEKYKVKVPYKVRKDVEIIKKIPKKYTYVEKEIPIVKKVKVSNTIGCYKYVGKTYLFGIQTYSMSKAAKNKLKKLKKAGWKVNKNKHKGFITEGGYVKHYYYFTKKVSKKQSQIVGFKYKKVKKPLFMTIRTWAQNSCPKDKVWVVVSWNGYYTKAKGYTKIT